jgi:hypothetical protein
MVFYSYLPLFTLIYPFSCLSLSGSSPVTPAIFISVP